MAATTTKPTTPEVFAAKMQTLTEALKDDEEKLHKRADDLLCEMLVELGYTGGVKAFRAARKWYA